MGREKNTVLEKYEGELLVYRLLCRVAYMVIILFRDWDYVCVGILDLEQEWVESSIERVAL